MSEIIEQGTDAWRELRRGLATGSNFSDVMAKGRGGAESVTRRKYRRKLALEIINGKVSSEGFQGNMHTERGKELEAFARMSYELETGEIVTEVPFVKHKYLECGVSPDGLVGDDGLVEFKAPISDIHMEYMELPEGTPPDEYRLQIMGQLWVTERKWCDFVSYCEEMPEPLRMHVSRIFRDEQLIAELEAAVSKFMFDVRKTVDQLNELARKKAADRTAT